MPTTELEERAAAADLEAEGLREELDRLHAALDNLTETLDAAESERDVAKGKVRELHLLLDTARATEGELRRELTVAEHEAAALRRELMQARTTAEIRGRLIDQIVGARPWRRGRAIRRAERVQSLLAHR